MAATLKIANFGRGPNVFPNLSGILVTIDANGATYATASGGLPIDLTGILQQGAPPGWIGPAGTQALNPNDVAGIIMSNGPSTNGFIPSTLLIGTPTYTTPPGQSTNDESANPGFLATCPATVRLYGTGAANHGGFTEVADGANSDVFTAILLIQRSGANS